MTKPNKGGQIIDFDRHKTAIGPSMFEDVLRICVQCLKPGAQTTIGPVATIANIKQPPETMVADGNLHEYTDLWDRFEFWNFREGTS